MGAFWGLPDFGARQAATDFEIYASYEAGPYLLWPTLLSVGLLGPGRPDFQIVLVRSSGTGADYGVLDLGIDRQQDTDGALAFLRAIDAKATVALVPFQSGFIRLVTGPDLLTVPSDLLKPAPLGWGGIDATRWNIQLSADSASLLKAGLTNTLVLTARAEVEVLGVTPRVASTAVFDPAALVGGLVPAGAASRQIPRTLLDQYFLEAPANLASLKLEGDAAPDREAFAQAMAGRVRMEYGRFVPSPDGAGPTYLEIAADIPSGSVRWNLAEPLAVLRPWVFTLDPFAAARALAKAAGINALYREVTTAPIAFGFFDVDVQAFLPPTRLGVFDLGVVIQVPPHLPFQPQADSHTVPFRPPDNHAVVHLRVPPLTKLSYVSRTYVEVLEGSAARRLDGAATDETTATLRLQPRDFPVDLLELSADPALLAVASLSGALAYTAPNGAKASTVFSLTTTQARVSVALPRDAASATVTLDAQPAPPDGSASLRLGPMPASAQHFTLGSFEEYGQHNVAIDCAFDASRAEPMGIDLLADGRPESTQTTLFLTKDSPTADWSYVTSSPFHAGYRWRTHPSGPWSASLPPGPPLHLTARGGPAAAPHVWDLDGVHVYALPGDPAERVRYVPGDPAPQLDSQGRPTLMLVDTGDVALLSLGTRLEISDAQRNDLEVALLEQLANVERIDFQPAGFTVGAVTLSLGDGAGLYQPLATTPSMGAPPYNATFSVQLRGDQRTRARAALGGQPRLLVVAYPLTLPPDVAATFNGAPASVIRTTDVASWFPNGGGTAHIQKIGG